jgi:hypothetical protein
MTLSVTPSSAHYRDTVVIESSAFGSDFISTTRAIFYDGLIVVPTVTSTTTMDVEVPVSAKTGMLQIYQVFPAIIISVSELPVARLSFIGISGDEPKLYNMLYLTVSGLPTSSVSTLVE